MNREGTGVIRIFAGSTGKEFAEKMCDYLDTKLGAASTKIFSDKNIFVRVDESIRNNDVYLVLGMGEDPSNEFVELLFWMDAFKRASANSVTAIIPYFGYAKGDKKDEPRVSIRARVCAESIELAGADRVITMELHSPQVQGFFKAPVDHLYSAPLMAEYFKRSGIVNEDLVVVSPDHGFAKRARAFADELGTPVAIGDKTRARHDEKAEIMNIIGDVEGKNCLVVDDFTISGGTIVGVSKALRDKGAKKIYAALSHILLKQEGIDALMDSPIELLVSTDTVRCPLAAKCPKVKLISVAPLFAETVKRIHDKEPVGQMFKHIPEKIFNSSFGGLVENIKLD